MPFPTPRLATVAQKALDVDKELTALVRRTFTTVSEPAGEQSILRAEYRASTNRMLRVAVNTFMDSLKLVMEVMENLDMDVLEERLLNDSMETPT